MSNEVGQRRKFFVEDLPKYFMVEHLQNSIVDPDIAPFLENYDISQDPEFSDENVTRRLGLHQHWLDKGFKEDRRIYAALVSKERGYGAFAEVYIPAWTLIGEYTGMITNKHFNTDYAWIYHSTPKDDKGNILKLRIDARTSGNMMRFLNHSNDANCSVIHVPHKNRWRTLYITNTQIMPDEELTSYYGENYWIERNIKVD
jgi:SET domain-containing protein